MSFVKKPRPLQNSPKSPKFLLRHLGNFGEFCKGLNLPTYTDNIPNIAMKKRLLLLTILPLSLYAADVPPNVKPELQVNTAEPQQPETHNIPAEQTNRPSEKIINVDADTLLANTELLARAMYSAVVAHNIPGIKAVLPIYEQWPEHDRAMARYAKGLLAQPPKPSAITAALSPSSPMPPPSAGSLRPPCLKTNKTKPQPTSSTNCKPNPSRPPCKNASKPTAKPYANATHGNSMPA